MSARLPPWRYSPQELRERLSSAVGGNPWHFVRGAEPVPLAPIVSPLRFDIAIRADYVRFFRANRSLYENDEPAYIALAREHAYFTWFSRVWAPAFAPDLLRDPARLEAGFARRVRSTAALIDSFERNGFDAGHPVTLRAGREVLPTRTGKLVVRDYYAGDGCHRLALLLEAGRSELEPGWYRVKVYRRFAPTDTTPLLLEALQPPPDDYQRFLAMGEDERVPER